MNLGLVTAKREATRSGPIGLAETRGNGYVVSNTLLKKKKKVIYDEMEMMIHHYNMHNKNKSVDNNIINNFTKTENAYLMSITGRNKVCMHRRVNIRCTAHQTPQLLQQCCRIFGRHY